IVLVRRASPACSEPARGRRSTGGAKPAKIRRTPPVANLTSLPSAVVPATPAAEIAMRAARFHEHGRPEVVRIEEVDPPPLQSGHVRVSVRAAAMNHLDLWIRRGLPIDTTLPHIGGSDIAG